MAPNKSLKAPSAPVAVTPTAPASAPVRVVKVSANAAAVLIGARIGRPLTAKMVRTVARDTLAEYQDDAYTPHAYDAATIDALTASFTLRASRSHASRVGSGPDGALTASDVAAALGVADPTAPSDTVVAS